MNSALSRVFKKWGEKYRMKIQMILFGYNTKKFIYNKVAYIFLYAGVTIFKKKKLRAK